MRTIDEILDKSVNNALIMLRDRQPIEKEIKRTGNKKSLHQKSKNKVNVWKT